MPLLMFAAHGSRASLVSFRSSIPCVDALSDRCSGMRLGWLVRIGLVPKLQDYRKHVYGTTAGQLY